MSAESNPWEDMRRELIADLCTAVEQIKREPRPQPDMVPWDEYVTRVPKRESRAMHWRNRKRGKRRAYLAMRSGLK